MANLGRYNELEYLILAMVGDGVCSGYAIRKTMIRMRGGRWNPESGAIYRVLRRLQKDNLIEELAKTGPDNRERIEYKLTGQGKAVLDSWLTLTPDRDELGCLFDAVRARSFFIGRLSQEEQERTLKGWIAASQEFCQELEQDVKARHWPKPIQNEAFGNLLYLAKARHEWLKKMMASVKNSASANAVAEVTEKELTLTS